MVDVLLVRQSRLLNVHVTTIATCQQCFYTGMLEGVKDEVSFQPWNVSRRIPLMWSNVPDLSNKSHLLELLDLDADLGYRLRGAVVHGH